MRGSVARRSGTCGISSRSGDPQILWKTCGRRCQKKQKTPTRPDCTRLQQRSIFEEPAYSTATLRAFRPVAGGRGARSIRSSCHRQKRMTPSSTCRRTRRSFSRSTPASSRISETMQHGRRAFDSRAMGLLLAKSNPQPLVGEGRPKQAARREASREQDVAPLVVHLHHQLLAAGPDLDPVLLRKGQADVVCVALPFFLHLHRLLLEEDRGGIRVPEHLAGEDLEEGQPPHLAVAEAGLEEGV